MVMMARRDDEYEYEEEEEDEVLFHASYKTIKGWRGWVGDGLRCQLGVYGWS